MASTQEKVHRDFHNYDWSNFTEFQTGLQQILDHHLESLQEQDPTVVSIPPVQKQQLIDQAKSFFYCSSTGNILNLDEYYAWRRNAAPESVPHVEEETAEKVHVKKIEELENLSEAEPLDTPYSSNYQQLVELIVSGKEVPGIKDIPDTVLSEQKSESQAQVREKPWAKQLKPAAAIQDMTS